MCWGRLMGMAFLTVAPLTGQEGVDLRAREVARFGDVDGVLTLTRINDAVAVHGLLFIAQPREFLVRVLDGRGQVVREMGGYGEGPGEFKDVEALALDGEELVVLDRDNGRLTYFSLDGDHLRTIRAPGAYVPSTGYSWLQWFPLVRGRVLYTGSNILRQEAGTPDSVMLVRVAFEGVPEDTLQPVLPRDRAIVVRNQGRTTSVSRPVHTGMRYDASPDGRAFFTADGRGDHILLESRDVQSGAVRARRVPAREVEVPRRWADSVVAARTAYLDDPSFLAREQAELLREAYTLPRRVPAVETLVAMSATEAWMSVPRFDPGPVTWRKVDLHAGTVELVEVPAGVRVLAREGAILWGVAYDELAVPYVVKMELEPLTRNAPRLRS